MNNNQKVEILLHRPLIRTVEEYWNFRRMYEIVGPIMNWILVNEYFSDERQIQAQFVLDFLKETLSKGNEDDSNLEKTMRKRRCNATLALSSSDPLTEDRVVGFCLRPEGHRGKHKATRPTCRKQWVNFEWDIDCGYFCNECGEQWTENHKCEVLS